MSQYHPLIEQKLKTYSLKSQEDEENALKEILQETALYALATADFFTEGLFQGGTALRILYQLPRFSEDLDFILKKPNPLFRWQPYVEAIDKAFRGLAKTTDTFCHPRVGGDPVQGLKILDSRLRGNDKSLGSRVLYSC